MNATRTLRERTVDGLFRMRSAARDRIRDIQYANRELRRPGALPSEAETRARVEHDAARGVWTLVLSTGKRIEFHDRDRLERFRTRNGL